MPHVKHRHRTAQKPAATNHRNFRTFLLVAQFEAEAIGARIAKARREAGLTQEELAEMASFSKRSLQDYEAGVTVPYRHLRELAALLNQPVEWFLHGVDQSDPESLERLAERVEAVEGLLRDVLDLLRERPRGSREAP
jgi:transcriptional regulator with XRE-family HTH domain